MSTATNDPNCGIPKNFILLSLITLSIFNGTGTGGGRGGGASSPSAGSSSGGNSGILI